MFASRFRTFICNLLIFSLLSTQVSPWAQAQIQDSGLIYQYRAILEQVKHDFSNHSSLNPLDTDALIEQFQTEGLDTPETRDLLDRIEALLNDPQRTEAYIQLLNEWQKKLQVLENSKLKLNRPVQIGPCFQVSAFLSGFITLVFGLIFGSVSIHDPSGLGLGSSCEPVSLNHCRTPQRNDVPYYCYNCTAGSPAASEFLLGGVDLFYRYFSNEAKTLFWSLELGIPASLLLITLSTLFVPFLAAKISLSSVESQIAQIRNLHSQLFADLRKATGIPALIEISEILASRLIDNPIPLDNFVHVQIDDGN